MAHAILSPFPHNQTFSNLQQSGKTTAARFCNSIFTLKLYFMDIYSKVINIMRL